MRYLTIMALAVMTVLTSCTKVQISPDYDSIYYIMPTIEDGITYIYIETEEIFPRLSYSIHYSLNIVNKDYKIEFLGISEPSAYYCSFGPAMLYIPLGKIDEGNYNISFKLDNIETNARLKAGLNLDLEIEEIKNIRLLESPYQ